MRSYEYLAFSPEQVERVFKVAQQLGLPVKLHAEQLSSLHGLRLAARYQGVVGGPSGIHDRRRRLLLPWLNPGTVAVLLPGAFYFLRETQLPPMEALRKHG